MGHIKGFELWSKAVVLRSPEVPLKHRFLILLRRVTTAAGGTVNLHS